MSIIKDEYACFSLEELEFINKAMGFALLDINGVSAFQGDAYQAAKFLQGRIESMRRVLRGTRIEALRRFDDGEFFDQTPVTLPKMVELVRSANRTAYLARMVAGIHGFEDDFREPKEDII